MKKVISILICVCLTVCLFAGCSSKKDKDADATSVDSHIQQAVTITTDPAKITDEDAINLIKSYSAKELGLTDEQKNSCSFMVAASGVKVEKDYYVQVIATVKNHHQDENGDVSYTFDNKGEYYIRYDGQQILQKNLETGEYTEMKVKEVPVTADVHSTTQAKE